MILSKRLQTVADMVTKGMKVADVGTDHGYIPIYLVKNQIAQSAVAMDINKGPIERAKENIKYEGLEDKIQTIQSDGMEKLESGMADSVVIAGMGGELIVRILENSPVIGELKELVLSPHSEIEVVREYLVNNGWSIVDEKMVIDNNKYYTVMKAKPVKEENPYKEVELLYGRILINNKDEVFMQYLEYQYEKYSKILSILEQNQNATGRSVEIKRLMKLNRKAGGK